MSLQEEVWGDMDCVHLAQDRDRLWVVLIAFPPYLNLIYRSVIIPLIILSFNTIRLSYKQNNNIKYK